ncbi:MAG: hypothetical protein Q9227_003069 [Pyrenula ochraceoflavens]
MDEKDSDRTYLRYRSNSIENKDGKIHNDNRLHHARTPSQISKGFKSPDTSPQSPFVSNGSARIRRPLVDYCVNDWKKDPKYYSDPFSDPESETDEVFDRLIAVLLSPRSRRRALRVVFILLVLIFLFLIDYNVPQLGPRRRAENELLISLTTKGKNRAGGWFGTNVRPSFPDVVQVQTLNSTYLPQEMPPVHVKDQKRLIIIGDVHGCRSELLALLEVVSFDPSRDHLIFVGDLITKGPDSPGVVDLAQKFGASCVRGNHEDRILLVQRELVSPLLHSPANGMGEDAENATDAMDEPSYAGSSGGDKQLAQSLSQKQLDYLQACPVILRVGRIVPHTEIVVVHAGLVPGIPFENQDPISAMSMRTIDLETHVPSKRRKAGVKWSRLWNKHQALIGRQSLPPGEDADHTLVVYGHDSSGGLQVTTPFTKGIDTGCYKGGQLTAMIIADGGKVVYKQVNCRDYRPRIPENVKLSDILNDGKETEQAS